MTQNNHAAYDEHIHALLERYLAGECTLPERAHIEAWLQVEPARRAYLESLRTAGEMLAEARPRFDSQAAWRRMAERTMPAAESEPATAPRPRREALQQDLHRRPVRRWLVAGAVAAAAVLGVVTAMPRRQSATVVAPAAREYVTAAGQQMALTLPDGSKVRLAPQSTLVIENEYGRATRTVRLVGQAHFEVTHDAARPFRVLASNTVAWDLGTKFTVRAYAGELFRLAVQEGSVAIPQALTTPLLAGDVATVDSAGRGTVEHAADLGRYTRWLDGTLEFQKTPLGEAAADLSRWYGVEVVVGDPALIRRHITVTINESSIDAALDLIAPAVGARYERRGHIVTLYALETP